jgi:hypothetical protein
MQISTVKSEITFSNLCNMRITEERNQTEYSNVTKNGYRSLVMYIYIWCSIHLGRGDNPVAIYHAMSEMLS